ncbi:hypothetical protein BBO_03318 [Beauveria brongniartii RCEF 3172]|uniref:Uncharacterized protein n=1 Tax=Beauveria brongniartii RCEF 3172 TaxID=1081107 RepID=A0A162JSR9_9HYPO|nr:hypothetical protein BBO_03318 [Beauveria brongniartii RCEF 3172]
MPENPNWQILHDTGRQKRLALQELNGLQEKFNELVEFQKQVSELVDQVRVAEGKSFSAAMGDNFRFSVPAKLES